MMMRKLAFLVLLGILWSAGQAVAVDFFDWREFGERQALNAPTEPLARARYIVTRVGQELKRQNIKPNSSFYGRARSFLAHQDQALGTCNDLAEVVQDALNGAGFKEKQLYSIVTSKQGLSRLNKGWLFDVNLEHAVPVLLIDGKPYTFDLWAHGGLESSFDNFDKSIWNGLALRNWSITLQDYGYTAFSINKGKKSEFNSADLNLTIRELLLRSGQGKSPGNIPVTGPGNNSLSSEDKIVQEYQAIYPAYLRAFHKGKRVEVIANAVKMDDNKYRCANKIYDIIKDGPRQGEEYCCSSFDNIVPLYNLSGGLPEMKKFLGQK
jgi:hypothetical protein